MLQVPGQWQPGWHHFFSPKAFSPVPPSSPFVFFTILLRDKQTGKLFPLSENCGSSWDKQYLNTTFMWNWPKSNEKNFELSYALVVSCNDDVKSGGFSLNFLRKDMKGPSTNLVRIFQTILFWKHKKMAIAFWCLLAQDFLPGLALWTLFWLLSWNNYKTTWSTSSIQHFSLVSVTSLNPLQPTPSPCLKIDEKYLVNC